MAAVVAEHRVSENRRVSVLVPAAAPPDARALLVADTPVLCCRIEGATWEDCLRRYDEHMGRGGPAKGGE